MGTIAYGTLSQRHDSTVTADHLLLQVMIICHWQLSVVVEWTRQQSLCVILIQWGQL
jgi:hypothetical protein